MNIGVLSDSHDHVGLVRQALEAFAARGVGAILHAGDIVAPFTAKLLADKDLIGDAAVHVIYGNNDGERAGLKTLLPRIDDGPLRVELGGRVIVMHHFIKWFTDADLAGADVVISGHNHEARIETRDGVLYLNPGETCGVLTGRPTAAILDTETLAAEIIDLKA